VTVGSDNRAPNLLNQGAAPVNSVPNTSQPTGNKPASRLARNGPLKHPHTGCSISVAIPVTESLTSPWTHARHNRAGQTHNRNGRSDSSMGVDSDDSDDHDYVHGHDGLSDILPQPCQAKSQS
jgi:hypothetical protein